MSLGDAAGNGKSNAKSAGAGIARFIGTELTDTTDDVKKKKAELVEYFAPLSSKERIESLLFVDMVFRLHNSLFENDTFELTDKWLSILK